MSVKEKEIQIKEEELGTKNYSNIPDSLFDKPAEDIVDGLLKAADGDEELALKNLNSYINKADDGLTNKSSIDAAKKELEKKVEAKMENKNSDLYGALNDYFKEAYETMFEKDNTPFAEKPMRPYRAIDYLISQGINPYWQIVRPRPALYYRQKNKIVSLAKIYNSGNLILYVWKNGQIKGEEDQDGKFVPDTIVITPDEFKEILADPKNIKTVDEFNRHYRDLDELVEIMTSGDELYDAWMNRFFDEHGEELGLTKVHSWKTHKAFKDFWNGLSDYEKSKYGEPYGAYDPWKLATKDPRKGMPIGKIRFKKSPTKLNGKAASLKDDPEAIQRATTTLSTQSTPEEDRYRNLSGKDLIEYWLDKFDIGSEYANKPIEDASGAQWNIVKAIETHNETNPVKFRLAFSGNPDFVIVKTPAEVNKMIKDYEFFKKKESISEGFRRFNSKDAQLTITAYVPVFEFLEKMGIPTKFLRGARLYGDLGQQWRIVGYNLTDPENPMIAVQSFERSDENINSVSKVMSHKIPLDVIQQWVKKPINQNSEIEWDDIMLDPFQRQKASAKIPNEDDERKPKQIKQFDKVAARAKHGVF